jgi:hypothetical protein
MASPASNVDFDRDRIGPGELIAGISGLVLLISLWFKWYGVKISGGGILRGFEPSITAWQAFDFIDLLLFVIALIAIGVAVMRGLNKMPDMPYPPATLVAAAGGLALLLVLFRTIVTPIDTGGVDGIDVTRKFGLLIGLLSAAGVAYGGWRAMQDSGQSFGSLGSPGGGAGTPATTPTAPTSTMPAGGGGTAPPAAPASDPVPGETAPQTPPGLAGEPPAGGGTQPPGIPGDRNPPAA